MEFLQPPGWPRPKGYANGVMAQGRLIFTAGQVGWDADGCFPESLADQVEQTLSNIVAVLEAAGAKAEHVTRLTWYITDREAYLNEIRAVGAAYRRVMGRHFPAMAVVQVVALMEQDAQVEIEATAVLPD